MKKRGDGLSLGKYCYSSTLFSLEFLCLLFSSFVISPLNVCNCVSIGRGHAKRHSHTPFLSERGPEPVMGQPSGPGRNIDGKSDGPLSLSGAGRPNPTACLVPQTMELVQREQHRSWDPRTDVNTQRMSSTS